jgi:phage replication O-like protein O
MLPLPNYTQVPNVFIDEWMQKFNGSVIAVLLAICRKTIGWHKETDSISLSQLCEMTGFNTATVKTALHTLRQNDLIRVDFLNGFASRFTLNIKESDPPQKLGGEGAQKLEGDPLQKLPPTKEREIKTKDILSSLPAPTVFADPKPVKIPKAVARDLKRAKVCKGITDYYQQLFLEEYGAKPTWDGRVMKLVHADIARLGDQLLGELIQLFFEDPTAFVKNNGTGMGYNIFHSQIDCLLEKRVRKQEVRT